MMYFYNDCTDTIGLCFVMAMMLDGGLGEVLLTVTCRSEHCTNVMFTLLSLQGDTDSSDAG